MIDSNDSIPLHDSDGATPHTVPHHRPLRPPWDRLLPLATRVFVWAIILGTLVLLKSFFALIFLTFVFAYIQAGVVSGLSVYAPKRRVALVALVGVLFLSIVVALSIFLAPRVYQQAAGFAKEFSVYMEKIDQELLEVSKRYPSLQDAIPELKALAETEAHGATSKWSFKDSPSMALAETLLGLGEVDNGKEQMKLVLDQLANISSMALAMISTFLLALLFSFLIVLDLPHLTSGVKSLEYTKLRFIYEEAADNIYQFGKVLGHAMQAQFYIACINTVLTALGIYWLGMGSQMAFLSVIVFLCSFVPVAGVFISSVPICLVALKTGGLQLVALSIMLITIIHMIEGYILNPNIYGARLRINPVIVLIVLTIGGKLFHIWGLILGLPVCTYLFAHAIRHEPLAPVKSKLFPRRAARNANPDN